MKRLVTGIVAHVDAGKTTLSEAMLYLSGKLRSLGRVDKGDAFLDNFALERARGITIFSKQAELVWKDCALTLLDTPGHVDFSAEMERTLQVLDAAILVVSGADGVQGHTRTLWRLLDQYGIPVFLFVNKMDQPGTGKDALLRELKEALSDSIADASDRDGEAFLETAALCEEELMEQYLETGELPETEIRRLIRERKLFPCWFGSALRLEGVEDLCDGIAALGEAGPWGEEFGAKVFKITRDDAGNRLSWMKLTGGSLKPRTLLCCRTAGNDGETEEVQEKITQIRRYSGEKFESLEEAQSGEICTVLGLTATRPGQGLGEEPDSEEPVLEPVLTYRICLPAGMDPAQMMPKLLQLTEEEPELSIVWDETLREIQVRIMGEVQLEILQSLIAERYGVDVTFDEGNIIYRETIQNTVEGVGHFEPLRHYAEVHLLLQPGEPGSGLVFDSACSTDFLALNWQRLVLTHLAERVHRGVLTGSAITDMKITLIAGRAHVKHTEGGDFRQATYRAVRQGLMKANSLLLEPWYSFRLTVPVEMIGRAMTDIENRSGIPEPPVTEGNESVLTGVAPVATMRNYAKDVAVYTRGHGQISLSLYGYLPCHNAQEIIETKGYDPDADLRQPSGSVFCTHGAGFYVPWNEVESYMHLPAWEGSTSAKPDEAEEISVPERETFIGTDEIDAILARTYYANGKDRSLQRKGIGRRDFGRQRVPKEPEHREFHPVTRLPAYLLVDGYNIIYAWEELRELARINVDASRERLLELMGNYRGMKHCEVIVVFDAYRVPGHRTEWFDVGNIHVVYTKEAETADRYIERFSHENARKYDISVATSDGMEQIIIRGAGCRLLSAKDLQEELGLTRREEEEKMEEHRGDARRFLLDETSEEIREALRNLPEAKDE